MKKLRLDSKNLTLCFSLEKPYGPEYLYFGPKVSPSYSFKKQEIKERLKFCVGMSKPLFSTFGGYENQEYSHLFLNSNGGFSNDFKFLEVTEEEKYIPVMPSGRNPTKTVCFSFFDYTSKISLKIYYSVYFDCDIFSCYTKISNLDNNPLHIKKASSLSFRINETNLKIVTFNGSWCQERHRSETILNNGLLSNFSTNGSSSPHHNPFTMMIDKKKHAYGFNLIYSGNHKTTFEAGYQDRMNVIVGINDFLFDYKLEKNEDFYTPECVFSYGNNENELTHNFHNFVKNHILQEKFAKQQRPIIFNNWEGTYFNFNGEKVYEIAKVAKELGGELFVLDDGWFSNRNSDTCSLGDWWSNKEKTGGGLDKLSKKIKNLGLKFGIWMEPEMISPDSDLYRNHPEYTMRIPGKEPLLWRNQYMLDLTNEEVKKFVIETICNIIDESEADYVKWDYNRHMSDIYLANGLSGEYFHRYMLSFYEIMNFISEKYPNVLFEGCASGGGRFDLGMLFYFSQVWASDCTDPRERIFIQDGSATAYPQICVGAHVSSSPIHTTGKTATLKDRFNVACSMNLGYELDPTLLNDEEKEIIKKQIQFYKENRELIQFGELNRIYYKDIFKGILISDFSKDSHILFIFKLKDSKFDIKLPNVFNLNKKYKINEKFIDGKVLVEQGLPHTFFDSMNIDKTYTDNIDTLILFIN